MAADITGKRRLSPPFDASFLRLWFLWTVIYRVSRTPSDSLTMPWFEGRKLDSLRNIDLFVSLSLFFSFHFAPIRAFERWKPSLLRDSCDSFNSRTFRAIFGFDRLTQRLLDAFGRSGSFRLIFRRSRCGYSLNEMTNLLSQRLLIIPPSSIKLPYRPPTRNIEWHLEP